MPKRLDLPDELICRDYLDGISTVKLADMHKVTHPTILKRLKENNIPIIKHRKCSEETKIKLSANALETGQNKGKNNPMYGRRGADAPGFGMTGDKNPMFGVRGKDNKCFGTHMSYDSRARSSSTHQGQDYDAGEWTGFIDHDDARRTTEYRRWRKEVFARDNYTCIQCGEYTGGNLNAHHIHKWSEYPELRTDIDNGITLCTKCHDMVNGYENEYIDMFIMLMN